MICPLGSNVPKKKCGNRDCVFFSTVNRNGCFHGEPTDVSNVAYHKGTSIKYLKSQLAVVEDQILYTLKLLKYAEFCSEEEPTEADLQLYRALQGVKPYNSRLFAFVTPRKFARMNRAHVYDAFGQSGVELTETLKEFLHKPLLATERR